jgi:small subunit ribosomal protein S20
LTPDKALTISAPAVASLAAGREALPPWLSRDTTRATSEQFGGRRAARAGRGTWNGIKMANTTSAKKATRKIARRTVVNRGRRSRVRGFVRKVEEAIAAGDKATALAALHAAEPELMRAAGKGVVHKNTASRKVSRLTLRIAKLGA